MRRWLMRALILSGLTALLPACATSDQWAEWRKHPTHFASGNHVFFSLRHTEGSAPRVRRVDIEQARSEQWWGQAITVSPEQIIAE
jgi:hypothetical protein